MSRSQRLETAAIRKRAAGVIPKTKQIEGKKIKFETDKTLKKDHVDSECGFALAHVICRPIWPECKSGNLTFFQYVVRVVRDLPDFYNSIMLTRINSIVVETRLLVVRL